MKGFSGLTKSRSPSGRSSFACKTHWTPVLCGLWWRHSESEELVRSFFPLLSDMMVARQADSLSAVTTPSMCGEIADLSIGRLRTICPA